jgi:hypothetical protein
MIRVIKLRSKRCAGHSVRMGETNVKNVLSENLKVRHHLGELNVDGRIILKRVFKK